MNIHKAQLALTALCAVLLSALLVATFSPRVHQNLARELASAQTDALEARFTEKLRSGDFDRDIRAFVGQAAVATMTNRASESAEVKVAFEKLTNRFAEQAVDIESFLGAVGQLYGALELRGTPRENEAPMQATRRQALDVAIRRLAREYATQASPNENGIRTGVVRRFEGV